MKLLSSWFKINRTLGAAILSTAFFCALLAFGTSPKRASAKTALSRSQEELACTASAVFSASFTQGQDASPAVVQQWNDFTDSLVPTDYDTVTISGSNDTTGRTLTDATIVPQ